MNFLLLSCFLQSLFQAFVWATCCPQVQQAVLSCQIFRSLGAHYKPEAAVAVLERLVPLLESGGVQDSKLTRELVLVFDHLASAMTRDEMLEIPLLFWAAVALLNTDCESHYSLGIKVVRRFMEALLSDEAADVSVSQTLIGAVPREWGTFRGFQHLVVGGFVSEASEEDAVCVLSFMLSSPLRPPEEPDSFAFISAALIEVVWLAVNGCLPLEEPKRALLKAVAARLASAAESRRLGALASACSQLAGGSLLGEAEFMHLVEDQVAKASCSSAQEAPALALLLGVAESSPRYRFSGAAIRLSYCIAHKASSTLFANVQTAAVAAALFGPLVGVVSEHLSLDMHAAEPWKRQARDLLAWVARHSPVRKAGRPLSQIAPIAPGLPNAGFPFRPFPGAGGHNASAALAQALSELKRIAGLRSSTAQQEKFFGIAAADGSVPPRGESPSFGSLRGRSESTGSFVERSPLLDPIDPAAALPSTSSKPLGFPTFRGFEEMLAGLKAHATKEKWVSSAVAPTSSSPSPPPTL